MAQNTTVDLPANEWVQLTDADVTSMTFQNIGGSHMLVKGAASAATPTNFTGCIRYNPGQGELNTALADLFPGISAVRVYAYSPGGVSVMVSHA